MTMYAGYISDIYKICDKALTHYNQYNYITQFHVIDEALKQFGERYLFLKRLYISKEFHIYTVYFQVSIRLIICKTYNISIPM